MKPVLIFSGNIPRLSCGIPTHGPSNAGDGAATFSGMIHTGEILVDATFSSILPEAGSTVSKLPKGLYLVMGCWGPQINPGFLASTC